MMGPPKTVVTLEGHGGLLLAADRWAAPGAPRVLLLHGGGQTRHAWGAFGELLARSGYDVMSLDLRGHGDSAWSAEAAYELTAFRDDVRSAVEALGGPVLLVGASLGGISAILAVGEGLVDKVIGLVLVDITPTQRVSGAELVRGFMEGAPHGFGSLDEAADAVAAYLPHRPRPADHSGLAKNLRLRDGRYYWHWDPALVAVTARDRQSADSRLAAAAARIKAPILLVRGGDSEIVSPEDVEALRRLAPQVEVREIPGARHMVAGDQNTVFGKAVLEFIGRVAPRAP